MPFQWYVIHWDPIVSKIHLVYRTTEAALKALKMKISLAIKNGPKGL